MNALLVFLGGGIGAALRYGVSLAGMAWGGGGFPWPTFVINVTGSLLMGILGGWLALHGQSGQGLRLFVTTGILGGYTTFSTFAMETVLLVQRGQAFVAAGYVLLSLVVGVLALALGLRGSEWFG